jgi:CheY-like chemotaxis protein
MFMILVVEDDEMMRDLLQLLLTAEGYKVICAEDGFGAIQLYEKLGKEIRLIVSDFELPGLNGLEVYRRIKRMNPDAKAIFVSGYLNEKLKTELQGKGVRHFISKPFGAEEVITSVRDLLAEDSHPR